MERGVYARLGVVGLSVVAAVWVLLPTFLGKEVQNNLELAAKRAAMDDPPALETPLPSYVHWLPNKVVNLGLDLQGGIDLTLEVGVEEGVLSSVQRDIPGLKSAAEKQDVKLASVRRDPKSPVLLIEPGEGTSLEQVQTLVRTSLRRYTYKNTTNDGGKTVHGFAMNADDQTEIRKRSVEQALETIRNRIDETGVKEPSITIKGVDGINVQLPGETNVEEALETVGTTARLVFMLVDEESPLKDAELSFRPLLPAIAEAEAAMGAEDFANDKALSQWLVDQGKIPQGRVVLWNYEKKDGVELRAYPYVLHDEELISGDDINSASTGTDPQTGQYEVHLDFKPRGSQIFGQVTGANLQKRFAIVLDDKVRSAPMIQAQIFDNCRITVGGDGPDGGKKEAGNLALVLRSGALPAPVTPGDVRLVSASLGQQAISDGLLAAGLGSALVMLFAAIYYRLSGLIACVSLVINVLLVVALLAMVGATLTLPGICGIALTVGMAVDCNIIIYERIREELRLGKSPKLALEAGFEHAVVAVVDSNVTTLLAGVVLYSYGTGPLKGFAVTLMIGIFTTLFSGVFVSRAMLSYLVGLRRSSTTLSI
jgi:preprotein translocase subunit SecD